MPEMRHYKVSNYEELCDFMVGFYRMRFVFNDNLRFTKNVKFQPKNNFNTKIKCSNYGNKINQMLPVVWISAPVKMLRSYLPWQNLDATPGSIFSHMGSEDPSIKKIT